MKVAVYAISLNEEKFVKRWFESAKDADYLVLADTGSTDKTVEIAKELGIDVHQIVISPWRFDDARNASLALIPDDVDYCIALDLDEILVDGWREELEKAFKDGITRPRYQYTWSWAANGKPDVQYGGDKIHSRRGYRWTHPVHEVLKPYGNQAETASWFNINIEHHPDPSKPRSQYFSLLKMAVDENPHDARDAFYYARELYFNRMYPQAVEEFRRYLDLPSAVWKSERSAAYRYMAKCDTDNAEKHLINALEESPQCREAAVELAQFYYERAQWAECYDAAKCAIEIRHKTLEYFSEDFAWGALPHDLLALSAHHIGKHSDAVAHGGIALNLNPTDERLMSNLEFYINASYSSSPRA